MKNRCANVLMRKNVLMGNYLILKHFGTSNYQHIKNIKIISISAYQTY